MNCIGIHKINGKIGIIELNVLKDGTYQVITDRNSIHYYLNKKILNEKWTIMYC